MSRHSYAALYYPYIHFKDETWLKMAALYWDSVARIVPGRYSTEDGDTVRELSQFVETIRPDEVDQRFVDRFVDFVKAEGERLRERYGIANIDNWRPVSVPRPPKAGGPSGSNPKLGYVFYEKMPQHFRGALVSCGLAEPDRFDKRWIGMHPRLTDIYMTALTGELASSHGLHPITDEPTDHVAVGDWTIERLAAGLLPDEEPSPPRMHEVEDVAAFVALQVVIPDPQTLSVDRVLEFRSRYPRERAVFQDYITNFVDTRTWLAEIRNPETLRRRLQAEYEKELVPKIADFREKLHDVNIGTTVSALGLQVGVPIGVTGAAAALGTQANPIAATAAGVALALIPILKDRRSARQEAYRSPVGYLMSAQSFLRPRTMIDAVVDAARRFTG